MKKLSYITDNNQIFNNTEIIDQFNQIDRDGNLDEEQKNQNILNVLNKIYDNCQLISKQSNLITQQITQEINIMSQFIKEFENQTKKASISMVENILKNLLIPINSNGFNYIQDILLSGKFERFLIIHNHFLEKYQINICEYQNFFDCAGIQNSFLIELSKIQIDTPDKINKYFQIFQLIFNSYKNLSPENKEQFKQLIIFKNEESTNFFDYFNKYHCNKAKIYNITEIIYELVKKNFSEEKEKRLIKYVARNQINYLKLTINEILNKEEQNSEGKQITQKQINIIINKFLQKNQSTGTEKKIFALDFIKKIFFSDNINENQKIEILEKLIKFIDFSEISKKDNIFLSIEGKIQSNQNKLKCLKILFNNLSEEEKISLYYNKSSSRTLIGFLHSIEYKEKHIIFYQTLIDNLPKIKSKRMEDLLMSIKNHYDLFCHLITNYLTKQIDKESFEGNMNKLIKNPNFNINKLQEHQKEFNFYQSPISIINFIFLKNSDLEKNLIENILLILINYNYKITTKDITYVVHKVVDEIYKKNNAHNIKNCLFILKQIIKYSIEKNSYQKSIYSAEIYPLIYGIIKIIFEINQNYPNDQDLINYFKEFLTKDFIGNYFKYNSNYEKIFENINSQFFNPKQYLCIKSINNSDLLELLKTILSHKDNQSYYNQLEQITKNETNYNNTNYNYKRKNSTEETSSKKTKTTNFSEEFLNWIDEDKQEYTDLHISEDNQEQAALQINSTNATTSAAASQPSTSTINNNQIFINVAQQIPALKQIINKLDPDITLNSQQNNIQKHSKQTLPNSQLSLNQINSNNRDPRIKQ